MYYCIAECNEREIHTAKTDKAQVEKCINDCRQGALFIKKAIQTEMTKLKEHVRTDYDNCAADAEDAQNPSNYFSRFDTIFIVFCDFFFGF